MIAKNNSPFGPNKKVLFVTYYFPPVGGAGIQRNIKHIKYLPKFGWLPFVISVKMINFYVYDESLTKEIPSVARIIRTGSLDPLRLSAIIMSGYKNKKNSEKGPIKNRYFTEGSKIVKLYRSLIRDYLSFPDPQVGWIPFAYLKGLEVIKKNDIRVIYATVNRFSAAIIAYLLSKKTGLPYVLDFPDGWTDDPYFKCPTAMHRKGHNYLEKLTVGNASAVTVYGDYLFDCFIRKYPWLKNRAHVLPNGFDSDDLKGVLPVKKNEKRRIVYTGSLYDHHEQNLIYFMKALNTLPESILKNIEVIFVGIYFEKAKDRVREMGLEEVIHFEGYIPHKRSLGYLLSADASLLFIRPGDISSITGKVFEYMMVRRPIIACIEPKGICFDILKKAGQCKWASSPDDFKEIADKIIKLDRLGWPKSEDEEMWQTFDRKKNTQKLSSILDTLISAKHF
jgi:glycosyltransferase involved in cell wall biosynthesis